MQLLPTSVRIVIMSHLSDLQLEINSSNPAMVFYVGKKLNFIKYLVLNYPDTNMEIIPDRVWERFLLGERKDLQDREYKESVFDLFKTSMEDWTEQACDAYLKESTPVLPKTLQEKKSLILDLEYNYIMQATKGDVDEAYLRILKSMEPKKDGATLIPVFTYPADEVAHNVALAVHESRKK